MESPEDTPTAGPQSAIRRPPQEPQSATDAPRSEFRVPRFIRVPVTRVKGLTERTADRLLRERARGAFTSVRDFYFRVAPLAEEMEALIRVGAFDELGQPRTQQVWEYRRAHAAFGHDTDPDQGWLFERGAGNAERETLERGTGNSERGTGRSSERGTGNLERGTGSAEFDRGNSLTRSSAFVPKARADAPIPLSPSDGERAGVRGSGLRLPPSVLRVPHFQVPRSEFRAPRLTEPSRRQRLLWESELLGFPASGHPLELYEDIAWNSYCPVARLGEHVGEEVVTCGLVIEERVHHQATGEPMKFLTLCDWTGMVETELFAATYKSYGLATVRYPVLEITARVEAFENGRGFTLRVLRAGRPRKRGPTEPARPSAATQADSFK